MNKIKKAEIVHPVKQMLLFFCILFPVAVSSCSQNEGYTENSEGFVIYSEQDGSVPLVKEGNELSLVSQSAEFEGVLLALSALQSDIHLVTGIKPEILIDSMPDGGVMLIAGTIGQNELIDELIRKKKLDVSAIEGKWEAYQISTLKSNDKKEPGTIVVAGSDKRGTIYGIYELSEQIGVSPWYWWADVPVKKHNELFVKQGSYSDSPVVKYRGIFLNDEFPALGGWAIEKFGGFNHQFYEHVFELILRLKGNFLWPAMWASAFYDDDTLNPVLADKYGVVIGTSHHEPLMRAHAEWARYGEGPWNYEENPENLQEFWRQSIRERKDYEALITVGMRGDGDEAMTEGTAIELLERIISDQRDILAEEMDKEPSEIPQVWALYKEVQEYYNQGMQVPEDITLLLCDDNWGNVRRLPKPGEVDREGGYGMYYHFDFVGGPVSYRWLNVSPISRTWEQMNLTYEHGVEQIWIVNVGDLKPMEFPIDFFLDHAWNPVRMTAEKMGKYAEEWAAEQFGKEHAEEIGDMLTQYTRFNYRRTPEMLTPETYSLHHFQEAETVVKEYNDLAVKAKELEELFPPEYRDAFYQLVRHPIEACSNLNELYITVAKNRLYAGQGRSSTNAMAEKAEALFQRDAAITKYYHTELSDGKWNQMMSQTHIGYTSWNNPDKNYMPEVARIQIPKEALMGAMIQGSEEWWPKSDNPAELPEFDNLNHPRFYIEVFNRGEQPLGYSALPADPWIELSSVEGEINTEERIWVSVAWDRLPEGRAHRSAVLIKGSDGNQLAFEVKAVRRIPEELDGFEGFVEANGFVSMEAAHFGKKVETGGVSWKVIPDFGRTLSGVTVFPTTHPPVVPGGKSPRLEYPVYIFNPGQVELDVYVAPSLNIYGDEGMQLATSFDDAEPEIYMIHEYDTIPDWEYPAWWNISVTDNIRVLKTKHTIEQAGPHTLKLWMVTPGVVIEKIVLKTDSIGETYLGPPESYYKLK